MTYEIKTSRELFQLIFEKMLSPDLPKKNRPFRPGDGVVLREWDGSRYTGRELFITVHYWRDHNQKRGAA